MNHINHMNQASLRVRLTPRAARNAIVREEDGILYVRVTAPPVNGAANRALVEYIAEMLGLRSSAVSIESGAASRDKKLRITGVGDDEIRARLAKWIRAQQKDA